ncbi:MAG TPA: hypothetical protein VHG72_12720 [Polyangia bacterium]|nr:hypothetical protein [Polyangia bacterium]
MSTPSTPRPFRLPRWVGLALLLVAIELVYVALITAGTFTDWPTWNTNYDLIAEGFRSGHLYIPIPPPPELLARPNPFDWSNSNLWFRDATLFGRHYYLYWGPFPALVLLGIKVVLRLHNVIGDQYVVFASYTLLLIAGALIIERLTRRLFPELPRALAGVGVVGLAFVSPTTFELGTPGIYQAAIAAAQALLVLGLLFGFDAVWNASEAPPARWRLVAAGCAWAAAMGCRVTAVLPGAAFIVWTAYFASAGPVHRLRPRIVNALWLGAPVGAVGVALLVYNKLRFGSWFELGVKYQLNTFPFVTSRKYLPLNLYSYLLRPLGRSCRFPFLAALYDIGARGFPKAMKWPPGYDAHEPQAGLFVTSPWTWLAVLALLFIARAVIRRARSPERWAPLDRAASAQAWCAGSFLALATLMPLPLLPGYGTTMRYVADFSTGMALLAVWGAWSGLAWLPAGWPRRVGIAVCVVLAAVTFLVAVLLGTQGYDEILKFHNPALYESLRHRLSFCGK